jgi:hypothetical protein
MHLSCIAALLDVDVAVVVAVVVAAMPAAPAAARMARVERAEKPDVAAATGTSALVGERVEARAAPVLQSAPLLRLVVATPAKEGMAMDTATDMAMDHKVPRTPGLEAKLLLLRSSRLSTLQWPPRPP